MRKGSSHFWPGAGIQGAQAQDDVHAAPWLDLDSPPAVSAGGLTVCEPASYVSDTIIVSASETENFLTDCMTPPRVQPRGRRVFCTTTTRLHMHKQPQRQDLTRSLVENGAGPCKKHFPFHWRIARATRLLLHKLSFASDITRSLIKGGAGPCKKHFPFHFPFNGWFGPREVLGSMEGGKIMKRRQRRAYGAMLGNNL